MQKNRYTLGIILLVAVIFRIAFLIWNWSGYRIIPENTLTKVYFEQGYCLSAGYGYIRSQSREGENAIDKLCEQVRTNGFKAIPSNVIPLPQDSITPEFLHPPGFPLLIAGIHRYFGIPAEIPIQLIGLVMDIMAVALLYLMLKQFFSTKTAFLSGLLYAMFLPLCYYSTISGSPTGLMSVFIIASLYCILIAFFSKGWMKFGWYSLGGIIIGISAYFRPDYMLLPVFMGIVMFQNIKINWKDIFCLFIAQAIVIIILFPWAYRNHKLSEKWIFTSSSVGATLITGLGEFDNPWGYGYTDSHRFEQAKLQGLSSPWSPEADEYFRELFIRSIKEHPFGFIKSIVLRFPLALIPPMGWGYENPNKTESFTELKKSGIDRYEAIKKKFGYVLRAYWDRLIIVVINLICLISMFAVICLERKRFNFIILFLSPHLCAIVSHLLTHIEPRFLVPSIFCYIFSLAYILSKGCRVI